MNNEQWKRGREWEIQCGPGERLSYSQNKPNKDLSKSNIGFLSASVWIPASKQTARPPSRCAGLAVVGWDFTFRASDKRSPPNTVTCFCFPSMSRSLAGLRCSSWGLNNRNTSHFPLGQRSRGSCTCVWSQIPSCLFSQSGIGGCALSRRDCESVKQYFPFFLFYLSPGRFVTEDRNSAEALCVCVPLWKELGTSFYIVRSCEGLSKLCKKKKEKLHDKCQSRMIQAVTVCRGVYFFLFLLD